MRPQLVDVLANNQHVVTHAVAGSQTVVCTTAGGQTISWGQGPHGGTFVNTQVTVVINYICAQRQPVLTFCFVICHVPLCKELGLGDKKSSAKPAFIETLTDCPIADVAAGYGTTIFVVQQDDKAAAFANDERVEKLPLLEEDEVEELEEASSQGKGEDA